MSVERLTIANQPDYNRIQEVYNILLIIGLIVPLRLWILFIVYP